MRTVLVALGCLALLACNHRPEDFAKAREQATAFQTSWSQRIDVLGARHAKMQERAQSIPPGTPGLEDLTAQLATAKGQLDALGPTLTSATDSANANLAAHHRKLASDTLARAGVELRTGADAVASALDAAGPTLDAVVAAGAAPPPPPKALQLVDPGFAKARSVAEVPGIEFKLGTADLDSSKPATKAALDSIVAFAEACEGLRFAIVGHTAKDGEAAVNQRLSEAQAQTVQAYLVAAQVSPAKIAQVQGVGGSQPLIAEPDPGSPEEAAMPVAQLTEIRAKNRRITVLVTEPCP